MRPPPLSHHSSPQFLLGILRLLWSLCSTKYKTSKLKNWIHPAQDPLGLHILHLDFTVVLTNCFQYIMSHSILGRVVEGRLSLAPCWKWEHWGSENESPAKCLCMQHHRWKNHVLASPSLRKITGTYSLKTEVTCVHPRGSGNNSVYKY